MAVDEVPLSDLLRRFGQDAAALVRHEITLAKLELRQSAGDYARDSARLAVAAAVGLLGALALMAFLIVGLGDLIDNYWLSALIIAVLFLGAAAFMAKSAWAHLKRPRLAPEESEPWRS